MTATRPLSIAYVFLDFGEGGAQRLALTWFRLLDRSRVRPTLFCLRRAGALVDTAVSAGVPARILGRLERPWDGRAALELARELSRGEFDGVHVATYSRAAPYAMVAARMAGVPLRIAHEHARPGHTSPIRTATDALLRRGANFIAASSHLAAALRASGVPAARVAVLQNGVEEAYFVPPDRQAARRGVGVPADARLALLPARLVPRKGHVTALGAWLHVAASVPGAQLFLAGGGPMAEVLDGLISAAELQGSVRLLGHRSDMVDLLAASNLVTLTSRLEGAPLAIIEAMAASRAVVATDIDGADEVVADGVSGRLVPYGDSGSLGAALAELLADPERADRMGAAGHAAAVRGHRAADMVRQLEGLYARWWSEATGLART